ncbi:MAG TPA: carbohydrate ABC transporter permease [Bacillales bacterium]|nr:carbohydrate ABC transporter permease [Bacillales bacterium]
MAESRKLIGGLLTLLLSIVYLSPIYILIVNSFKNRAEIYESVLGLPDSFSFQYYLEAIDKMNFFNALWNSLYETIVSIVILIILTSMAAWMLVRTNNMMSKIIFSTLVATMLIPFQTIMMPLMQFMNSISRTTGIDMLNTLGGLIYMNVGFHAAMAVFLYHGFIKSIPRSLEEAAIIDGCSKFGVFWRIVFPILKPITVTVMILNAIQIWNDYLLPSLTISNPELRTIPLSTFFFFGQFTIQWNLAMAGLVMTIIPVVIFYAFSQKYIIKGIGEGAVK